jgi:uncharacterized protein DUF6600
MTSHHLRLLSSALALATLLSCATTGGVPAPPSMPAARLALRPEYRIFYDALQDYGDWVLIEPFGFVFHPKVDFATFRPYDDGFWAPSDTWGWVWISAEPFGWATYHYGTWFWDRYQGWVWQPGVDWGPAWVSWQLADRYAGWAALSPSGADVTPGMIPGGAYLYAPLERMGSTDLSAHIVTEERLGARVASAVPADDVVEQDGIRINRGPRFDLIERAIGAPLPRVKLTEPAAPGRAALGRRDAAPNAGPALVDIEVARRQAEEAARRTRTLIEAGGRTPAVLPILRSVGIAGEGAGTRKRPGRPVKPGAAADSTH